MEWTEVPGRREVFNLAGSRVLIGRRTDADIVLSQRLTSRQHAEIVRQGDPWILVDLNSTHGTWVNGRRIMQHTLSGGDRIQLGGEGGLELIFKVGSSEAAHVPEEDALDTAEFSLSVRRLAEVLPEPAGQYSVLEKISCLLDFQYFFGKSFSPEKTFVYILRSALQISGAERGFILRKAPDDFAYALGLDASGRQLSEGEFGASRSVVDRVRSRGEPVFMTQGLESGLARQASIAAMKLRAVACLPLEAMTRETPAPEIVGILYLDSRKAMHSLSGLDRKVLTSLAGEAGRVLEKLEMVETLAEKRRVEQELTIAEETQRTLLPHSFAGVRRNQNPRLLAADALPGRRLLRLHSGRSGTCGCAGGRIR